MARPLHLLVLTLACAALALPSAATAATDLQAGGQSDSAGQVTPEEALSHARRISSGREVETGHELTLALRTLAVKLPQLDGADRRRAERLLLRPTQGQQTDNDSSRYSVPEATPVCGARFCVHYVKSTPDAPPSTDADGDGDFDYAETALREFENVYNVENNQLGWRNAASDGTLGGGNGMVDVYLANVGPSGAFGYAAVDPNQSGRSRFAYLVMDNDYAEEAFKQRGYSDFLAPLQVTAAHEYNHVLQYTYDTFQDPWLLEATATWMEDKVYDEVNDYRLYVDTFAQRPAQPVTQFNGPETGDTNDKVYGDSVLLRWIDERFGAATVRRAWELSIEADDFAPGAIDKALAERGSSFFDGFTQFAADTAEWRASNSAFEEGGAFPDMLRELNGGAIAPQNVTNNRNGSISGGLDHTGYALLNVDPQGQNQLTVSGTFRRGIAGAVAVVGRTGDLNGGTAVTMVTRVPNGGVGKVTLPNASSFSRVTALTINGDVSNSGFDQNRGDWTWKADDEPITLAVNDFTRPSLRKVSPKRNAKRTSTGSRVTLQFNEMIAGVTPTSVRLVGSNGRTVKTNLSLTSRGRVLRLTPVKRLGRGRRYAIKLSSAVTDAGGNPLPTSRRVSRFTTAR